MKRKETGFWQQNLPYARALGTTAFNRPLSCRCPSTAPSQDEKKKKINQAFTNKQQGWLLGVVIRSLEGGLGKKQPTANATTTGSSPPVKSPKPGAILNGERDSTALSGSELLFRLASTWSRQLPNDSHLNGQKAAEVLLSCL